jgi:hypothetical protein
MPQEHGSASNPERVGALRGLRAARWRGMVALSGLSLVLMLGCGFTPTRALGIPGAASRTPDLALPLQAADRNLALLYLDKKHPPRGQWENWSKEEIDAELATVATALKTRFQPILDVLAQAIPSARDLDATGRVGLLFDPAGASDEALDARLRGQIVTGDLRVGKLDNVYFVFYRRYPQCHMGEGGIVCRDATCAEGYCRLVIVDEVATRRE